MYKRISLFALIICFPKFIYAAEFFSNFKQFLFDVGGIVDTLTVLAVALALLFFFWGLAQFITKTGDPSANEEGKNKMIWGILALFVIVSIWGIVGLLQDELLPGGSTPTGSTGFPSTSGGSVLPPGGTDVPCPADSGIC